MWLVLHAIRQQSLQLLARYDNSPGPLSSYVFFLLIWVHTQPSQRGMSQLNISAVGGNFACVPSPSLVDLDDRIGGIVTTYDRIG